MYASLADHIAIATPPYDHCVDALNRCTWASL